VDSSLAILIGGTAIFAGVVAYLVLLRDLGRRGAGVAAAAAASAVTASFVLMLYLATVATPAVAGLVALLTGGVAYMVSFATSAGGGPRSRLPKPPLLSPRASCLWSTSP
jgi:hypothetical protein